MTRRGRTALSGAAPVSSSAALRALLVAAVPPAMWFLHLNVSYVLVPPTCSWGQAWLFALVTVLAIAAMVPGALHSWRAWQRDDEEGLLRFLGGAGLAMTLLFGLTTILVGASAVVIHPCH